MSGLGFLQAPCLTFTPFEPSRMCSAAKPSMEVRNRRFTPLKCAKITAVTAEIRADDLKRVCREMTIQEIPYVDEVVKKLAHNRDEFIRKTESDFAYIEEAYESCKIYYLGRYQGNKNALRILPEDQMPHLLALHAWCRRIDDLVDICDNDTIRSAHIDVWEERTKDILNGRPRDILDAALMDTVSKFHIDKGLFEDMLKGMRMDLRKKRYADFEELFVYCYYVSASVALMVIHLAPESTVLSKSLYEGAVYFAIALQLTNILNDVSDDAQLERIYLPQNELAEYGVCDGDIFSRNVTDGWREFMKMQIERARFYYDLGEREISDHLDKTSRSKILSATMMYSTILDTIEENDYDNLTKKLVKY